jgi:photosystem II stability/assembly factor-like uncharacterized protein
VADDLLRRKLHAAFDPGPAFPSASLLARTMARVDREQPGRDFGLLKELALAAAVMAVVALLAIGIAQLRAITHNAPAKHEHGQAGVLALQIVEEAFLSESDAAVEVAQSSNGKGAELFITHDGGQTWIRTGITSPSRFRVWWLDREHLLAATADVASPIGVGLKATDDGGYHWKTIDINSPGPWGGANLFFLNPSEGWAELCRLTECGPGSPVSSVISNVLFRTVDGGSDWQQLGSPVLPPEVSPGGLYFVDSNRGFMGTSSSDGVGRLVVTQDGGRSWRLIDLPPPPGGWYRGPGGAATEDCIVDACTLLPVMFGMQGVVLVEETAAHAWFTYTTSDGGLSWGNPQSLPIRVWQRGLLPLQMALGPSDWWTVDDLGTLYRTTDAGRTWHGSRPTMPAGYTLAYVKPVSGGVLWGMAARDGGSCSSGPMVCFLVRSPDSGTTWFAPKLPRP